MLWELLFHNTSHLFTHLIHYWDKYGGVSKVSWDEVITSSNPYTWAPPPLSFWMISSPSAAKKVWRFLKTTNGGLNLWHPNIQKIFLKSDFKVTVPKRFHQNFLTTCYAYSPNFRSLRVPNTRLAAGRTCFAQIAHTDVLGSDLSFNATIATGFWWRASRSLWFFVLQINVVSHIFTLRKWTYVYVWYI